MLHKEKFRKFLEKWVIQRNTSGDQDIVKNNCQFGKSFCGGYFCIMTNIKKAKLNEIGFGITQ